MRSRYKVLLLIIASLLFVTLGISFAYYTSKIKTDGEGSKIETQTAQVGDALLHIEGNLDDETFEAEKGILPGHKSVGKVKVYATREEATKNFGVSYNLIWEGANNLSIPLKYTVYKTTDENAQINVSCEEIKTVVGSETRYSEECTLSSDIIKLDSIYSAGDIPISEESKTTTLVNNESIMATENGEPVYYIVVIEYENKDENQSQDMSNDNIIKGIDGTIKIEPLLEKVELKDYILAKTPLQTDIPDFSKTSCTKGTNKDSDGKVADCSEATVGLYKCIIKEDGECAKKEELNNLDTTNLETTYYYRGDVDNNYVKFAGYYWRIIRINENGSLRIIYAGNAGIIDNLSNKEEVLASGYNDIATKYTQLEETPAFNPICSRAECVGFKYELGLVHGTKTKSAILEVLESWFVSEDNELQNYGEYLDTESGFCGDRSPYTHPYGTVEGGGIGTTQTYYGAYIRNITNKLPSFKCPDVQNDLYTTTSSSIGNKTLDYPIGLITADEVTYAGHGFSSFNYSYYLYTGNPFSTISPYGRSGAGASVFCVNPDGNLGYGFTHNPNSGVRPVINISPNKTLISGSGTINDPYVILPSNI